MKLLISCVLLFSMVVTISCFDKEVESEPWTINDFTEQKKWISLLMDDQPQSIQLSVKGEADGNFQILLRGTGAGNYRQLQFNENQIDSVYTQPWNSKDCSTIFLPGTAKSGNLTLDVKLLSTPVK